MTKIHMAYLAGLFNGEGCISIGQHRQVRRKRGCMNQLWVTVNSSDEWVCQTFKMAFGGSVYTYISPYRTRMWVWTIASKVALDRKSVV